MHGRVLGFAVSTLIMNVIGVVSALWVGNMACNKITELFNAVVTALNVTGGTV